MENPTETEKFGRRDVFFFLAAFVFIYSQLFQLPFTPIYFDGDVMVPVSNGIRMLGGETIYRDFFHFIPPGGELVYENLFRLFGIKVGVINFVILALGMGLTALLWFFSKRLLTGAAVYLPAAIFLVLGYRQFGIDGSYRLFSVIFALCAVAVLFKSRSMRNLLIAGCLCGIASFFVQTRGVLTIAAICVFLLWENFREGFDLKLLIRSGITLGGAFLFTILVTQSYFLLQAGWDNYYFSMVGFIQNHYRHDPPNNFGAFGSDLRNFGDQLGADSPISAASGYFRGAIVMIIYYLLIPCSYVIFLLYAWFKKRDLAIEPEITKLLLLCLVGIFLAAGSSAPTAHRLYQVAIPAVIIFVWLCGRSWMGRRLIQSGLVLLCILGSAFIIQRQMTQKYYLEMPAGYAAFLYQPTFEKYAWIAANTHPGETLYEPYHPNYYFPFHLNNPTPLYMARDSEYTPAFQVDAVVKSLEASRPRLIIWPKNWSKPVADRSPGDNLEPLWQFVKTNYDIKHVFLKSDIADKSPYGDIEVWELRR